MASSWPSEVPFASLLVYSPTGESDESKRSRSVCTGLKQGDVRIMDRTVIRLRERIDRGEFQGFFGSDVGFVPTPRSAPHLKDALWPADLLAQRFLSARLGHSVHRYLRRREAVPKSAYAPRGQRPTFQQHYDSIDAVGELVPLRKLLIIDDVLTRGRTLLACAQRLRECLPACEIRCFAVVRTMGMQPDIDQILDPCEGRIYWSGVDAVRTP